MSISRKLRQRAKYYLTRAQDFAEDHARTNLLEDFLARCRTLENPRVLELGTKRSIKSRSTKHDEWIPHAAEFLGTDIEMGEDVDFTADVHRLSKFAGEETFDVIISCSSFEHFKYPHLAAHEIMKTLKIGGLVFIQTHQSYPVHSAPYDYFRFSKEALAGLFGTKMGFRVIAADYEFPVRLHAAADPEVRYFPAYLNSRLFGEKIAKTPDEYIFEYDVDLPEAGDKKTD